MLLNVNNAVFENDQWVGAASEGLVLQAEVCLQSKLSVGAEVPGAVSDGAGDDKRQRQGSYRIRRKSAGRGVLLTAGVRASSR